MNAADREDRFRAVQDALAQPSSPRWKLVAMREFLEALDPDDAAAEAYVLELVDPLD